MDETTQQNAALVEEAAAAAESLQDQAASLSQAVAVFKTQDGSGRIALSSPARAANTAGPSARMATLPAPVRAAQRLSRSSTTSPGSEDEWEEF
jgi:methyl-accepting chemotaxis protein